MQRRWLRVLAQFALALVLVLAAIPFAAAEDGGAPMGPPLDAGGARHDAALHDGSTDAVAAIVEGDAAMLDGEVEAAAPDASADAEGEAEASAPGVDGGVPVAGPEGSAKVGPIAEGSPVKLRDKRVFAIRVDRAGVSAEERARAATQALDSAFDDNAEAEIRVDESQPGTATILVGDTPIVQLGEADAIAAGDASLSVHALRTANAIRETFKTERTRRDVATTVFHWSLVVFTGLIAFLAQRRMREIAARGRKWVKANPDRLPVLRIGNIELLRPAAFQGVIQIGFTILERALQLTILYVWFVFVLSLFDSTRGFGKRVTTLVFTPIGSLFSRLVTSLPGLVAGAVVVFVLVAAFRLLGLFFESVEKGETQLEWLPKGLARPIGFLTRLGIVTAAVVLGAPLVTGDDQGVASHLGTAMLAAFGLASVPILASAFVGVATILSGRIRTGDFVAFDGRQGRIASMTLLELRIHDGEGAEMRVPHLLTLVRPLRVLGPYRLATFEISVDAAADQTRVREVIASAAKGKHGAPRVRLIDIDADGARYEIVARRALDEEDPTLLIVKALTEAGIALGR
jgi:small-conductance mechanosensitive channel